MSKGAKPNVVSSSVRMVDGHPGNVGGMVCHMLNRRRCMVCRRTKCRSGMVGGGSEMIE
jgi:hypothetical protein